METVDFRIVEYEPSLAAALADMWTRSGDSWGGYSIEITEDSVRTEEESSVYENFFLAMVGDEVVGCCKLARWTEGEGALYIGVLNVRPDLHGKKIGKALMLRSVDRTIELGWPRLDLHTWPGNLKAVPLYKRVGFFWEERDREVYLVNFIPFVLKTELVADFFEHCDWYADSTREIRIEPDGRKENGFTYFTYRWESSGETLEMEFSRRGRGLRRIRRDGFTITATVERPKTVFGRDYSVKYTVENRTGAPAEVSIRGEDDGPVKFGYAHDVVIDEREDLDARFHVDPVETKQSDWKTHPSVTAEITFNGRSARFAVGIVPQFPVELELAPAPGMLSLSRAHPVYLNLESRLEGRAAVSVTLPDSELFDFGDSVITVEVPGAGRATRLLEVEAFGPGIYSERLPVVVSDGSDRIEYDYEVGMEIPGVGGLYHGYLRTGDNSKAYRVALGACAVGIVTERDTHRNATVLQNTATGSRAGIFFTPQLGEPYTEEFIHRPPDDVRCSPEGASGGVVLEADFVSQSIPGITLTMWMRLTPGNRIERSFVVTADESFDGRSVKVLDSFRTADERPVVPCDDTFLEARGGPEVGAYSWDGRRFTENWAFFRPKAGTVGVCWDPSLTLQCREWSFAFEHEVKGLTPGAPVATRSVAFVLGTFADWRDFRRYVTGEDSTRVELREVIDLSVAEGNPFPVERTGLRVREHRNKPLVGTVAVRAEGEEIGRVTGEQPGKVRTLETSLPSIECGHASLELDCAFPVLGYRRRFSLFGRSHGTVDLSVDSERGRTVYVAENGPLCIRSAPEYAPVLFSCTCEGVEWLGTLFPEAGPRDWWNPWFGGLGSRPRRTSGHVLLKEKREARLIAAVDGFGNEWRGIETRLLFSEHEELKGLGFLQRSLLLPGVPVVLHQVSVEQHTGKYLRDFGIVQEAFVAGPDDSADCTVLFDDASGDEVRIRSGLEDRWTGAGSQLSVIRDDTDITLTCFQHPTATSRFFATNKGSTMLGGSAHRPIEAGAVEDYAALFLVFTHHRAEVRDSLDALAQVQIEEVRPAE